MALVPIQHVFTGSWSIYILNGNWLNQEIQFQIFPESENKVFFQPLANMYKDADGSNFCWMETPKSLNE